MRRIALAAAVLALLGATPALADEAKSPIGAILLLDALISPAKARASAFDESLKDERAAPRPAPEWEVQADGTVRYGRVTMTVKNPCPPGTAHYEPPPLPGRRARN